MEPRGAVSDEQRLPGAMIAGLASIGAGGIHAAAAGIHAEHPQLARIFVVAAILQIAAGLWILLRPSRWAALGIVAVNLAAVGGWLATRLTGISWIDGLETSEAPQFADTSCAFLGVVAAGVAGAALLVGPRPARPAQVWLPALAVAALAVPAMISGGTHAHSHDEADAAHTHADGVAEGAAAADGHTHDTAAGATDTTAHAHDDPTVPASWPRPWDPAAGIDVAGVEGVSADQEARASALITGTLAELPRYSDPAAAEAAGYRSIGDASTGSEHFLNAAQIEDGTLLDPAAPESLVYDVGEDGSRTLAGAMYIASTRPIDDPSLTGWAGPLMQWHIHDNLCWRFGPDGVPMVVGFTDDAGNCVDGVRAGIGNPMVHVWIVPHPCGVFAALEGRGAGSAAVPDDQRADMCASTHDHGEPSTVAPVPYDPTKPIDLGGVAGVTAEQQAAAENLVAVNVVRLPQWADHEVAEAAGFKSIGDGPTGHEHYIQWDWINDDLTLDPDHPESLVYEPQPDGSKRLVSAMYMLPDDVALSDVPDIGGALMQWHIHDDLCFTTGDHPRVVGTTAVGGACRAPLVKFAPSPMIHVWITPHPCGPFAALEGVGAGQIDEGEERLCDHAHGSTANPFG